MEHPGTPPTTRLFSLELFPDPVVVLDGNDVVVAANAAVSRLLPDDCCCIIGKPYDSVAIIGGIAPLLHDVRRYFIEKSACVFYDDHHWELLVAPFHHHDGYVHLRIICKDITGYVHLEQELRKRNRELITINTLSSAFISSENIELAVEELLGKILLVTDYTQGWLLLLEHGSFVLKASGGISDELRSAVAGGGLSELCSIIAMSQEPMWVMESFDMASYEPLGREGFASLTAVPLRSSSELLGLVFLAAPPGGKAGLDFDTAALLSLVGNHVSLIIDKIRLFHETERLAITDGLTGLFNSRFFYRHLSAEIARANRYESSFSLILLDIDDFKRLNDTYGHQAGDDVLHDLARILNAVSRETDVVVRYGGEEFIIVLPNTTEEDTGNLADRLRTTVERHLFRIGPSGVHITISGGIATYPKNAASAHLLLNEADRALYAAKAAGKNMILCSDARTDGEGIQQTEKP